MKNAYAFALFAVLAIANAACASEGDLLIDLGPSAVFNTDGDTKKPAVGGNAAVSWGFNDHTDFGLFVLGNTANRNSGGTTECVSTGLQSWLTPIYGDVRPQVGGRAGVTLRNGNGLLHLAVQARALAEFSPTIRAYLGADAGADIGQGGEAFTGIQLGIQIRP
jgi:hypothetical protein